MPSQEIHAPDVYAILAGWARQSAGSSLAPTVESVLQQEAAKTAAAFDQHSTLQIQLNQGGLSLQRLLQRRTVAAWQALHTDPPAFEAPPERCPACEGLLTGEWHCSLCGLELSRWRCNQNPQQSLDSQGMLPWHYALLPDPRRKRLILLDLGEPAQAGRAPEVVWQINLNAEAVSARLLPRQEILLCTQAGEVLICDLFGSVIWRCEVPLKQPVFVDATRNGQQLLIADAGSHQVLIINRQQQVIWSYGQTDQPGREPGFLRQPSCLRLTAEGTVLIADSGNHRVIEVSQLSGQVRHRLAEKQQLEQPVWCERLPDGETLIVDAANYRLLSLGPEQALNQIFSYYQNQLDVRYRLQQPQTVIRRENGHYLLANAERIIEISPSQQRLLWFSLLTDLRAPASFEQVQAREKALSTPAKASPNLTSTRLNNPFKLGETLKQIAVFEDAPEAFFEKLKLCLRYEEHPAGKILLREGQKGDAMYLIREGEVEIIKDFQAVATLGPGEIFGEMALLNAEPRNATVRMKSSGRLYRLNKLAFESVVQTFPEVHERVRQIARVRAQMGEQVSDPQRPAATPQSARERLEKLMQNHRERLEQLRQQPASPEHHQLLTGPLHWSLRYTGLEQKLIRQARQTNYRCLELHVRLRANTAMKSVRISLLVSNLEKHGDIIRMHPTPEDILREKVDDTVIMTLLTRASRSRILEEACALADIQDVQAIPVYFGDNDQKSPD